MRLMDDSPYFTIFLCDSSTSQPLIQPTLQLSLRSEVHLRFASSPFVVAAAVVVTVPAVRRGRAVGAAALRPPLVPLTLAKAVRELAEFVLATALFLLLPLLPLLLRLLVDFD